MFLLLRYSLQISCAGPASLKRTPIHVTRVIQTSNLIQIIVNRITQTFLTTSYFYSLIMSKFGNGHLNYEQDNNVFVPSQNVAVMKGNSAVPPGIAVQDMSSQHGSKVRKYRDPSFIPMEHVYTRDCTGTVVRVSSALNIPMSQLVVVETRHASTGAIFHCELRFKNDVSKFFTSTWDPNPDFPSAHRDDDENTTTQYTFL